MNVCTNYCFFILSFIASACSTGGSKNNQADADSVKQEVAITMNTQQDTLSTLLDYFKTKSTLIPLELCRNYLGGNTEAYSSCFSSDMIDLGARKILVLRLNCTAGGTCEEWRLLVFDNGIFKSQLPVGSKMSDESFSRETTYRFPNDSLVELKTTNKEFNDDGDTLKDSTYLEYYLINKEGLIEKSPGLTH